MNSGYKFSLWGTLFCYFWGDFFLVVGMSFFKPFGLLFFQPFGPLFLNLSGYFFQPLESTFLHIWGSLWATLWGCVFFSLLGHTFGGNFKQRRKPRSQAPPFLFDAYSGRPSSDCAPPLLRRRSWPRCSDFLRLLLKLAFNFLDAGFAVPWRCPISDGQKNTGFFATQIPTAVRLCSASRALLATAIGIPGGKKYGIIFKISEVLHFCV